MGSNQQKPAKAKSTAAVVYVIDDDRSIQHRILSLLDSQSIGVRCYHSAEEFLDEVDFDTPGCVITELHLPGISGLELQETLRRQGVDYPVLVLASDADVPMAVRAMLLGAMDFLEKPFIDRVLIARVRQALNLVV